MRLDRATAALRPMPPWQAVDLGLAMVRRWWRSIITVWCVAVAPWQVLFWALLAALPDDALDPDDGALLLLVGWGGLWWLRPLFDRVVLHVLSRRLFGAQPRLREVLAALPALARRNLWSTLVWRRLDPARSFLAPIVDLEGGSGPELKARRAVIGRYGAAEAMWTTLVFILFDALLQVTPVALLAWAWPADPGTEMGRWAASPMDLEDLPGPVLALWALSGVVSLAITEPFYVGAGFGLYLSRRAHLEGWDIEVQLRGIAARLQKAASALAAVLFVAVALSAALAPTSALAMSTPEDHLAPPTPQAIAPLALDEQRRVEKARAAVRHALRFGRTEQREGWRLKRREASTTAAPSVTGVAASALLGPLLSWLIWALVGAAVIAVLVSAWRQRGGLQRAVNAAEGPPCWDRDRGRTWCMTSARCHRAPQRCWTTGRRPPRSRCCTATSCARSRRCTARRSKTARRKATAPSWLLRSSIATGSATSPSSPALGAPRPMRSAPPKSTRWRRCSRAGRPRAFSLPRGAHERAGPTPPAALGRRSRCGRPGPVFRAF